MHCTVVIPVHPAHNTDDMIGECLAALAKQDLPRDEWELVVVGDNCDPGKFLRSAHGLRGQCIALESHVGPIKARNLALSRSSSEIVAFLDADSVPCTSWLSNLLAGFADPSIAACGGRIEDPRHHCFNRNMVGGVSYALPATGLGNAAFVRSILDEVGWLDESLWIGNADELDLSWRIVVAGYRIAYVEEARIFHKGLPDFRECLSHGMGARLLSFKYSEVLAPSAWVQLVRYAKNFSVSALRREGIFECVTHLLVAAGYCVGLIKETLGIMPAVNKVRLPAAGAHEDPIRSHVVWWRHDGECTIVDFARKRHYRLADTAARIWELTRANLCIGDIAATIASEFEVETEQAFEDITELLGELSSNGLVLPA